MKDRAEIFGAILRLMEELPSDTRTVWREYFDSYCVTETRFDALVKACGAIGNKSFRFDDEVIPLADVRLDCDAEGPPTE
jgi:hypothetical protein